MTRFTISTEQHGYIVRSDEGAKLMGRFWAYSTLDDALEGLCSLITTEQSHD